MSRGRQPHTIALVPGQERPEPPAELDALERQIWRDVVNALPARWADLSGPDRPPPACRPGRDCATAGGAIA